MVALDGRCGTAADAADPLRPLAPAEAAARARVGWFEGIRLGEYLTRTPDLSWCAPGREYVIGGQWRRRADIACLIEMNAEIHRHALLDRFLERAAAGGARLAVLNFDEMQRASAFYRQAGFDVIDEIVRYERLGLAPPRDAPVVATRDFAPSSAAFEALLAIDHAAFPRLWWNADDEFRWYAGRRSSDLLFAFDGDRPVGYAGFTLFHDDGHLDRLAVLPEVMGRGFGAGLLREVFRRLYRAGARRIALTTQAENERAQRLYHWFGFHRTSLRYRFYGRPLAEGGLDRLG